MDERQLILRTRRGDKEAFNELVKAYQQRLYFAIFRLVRNTEEAKDLTQDAFVAAYQAIKGFRLRSSFYTWIYRVAINLCYHHLRSRQYRIKLKTKSLQEPIESEEGEFLKNFASSEPDPYQVLASKEKTELIQRGLATLKRKFYQAVILHDLEGLSYKDIAKIQRCSLGTVMSRLYRSRLQLAKYFKIMRIDVKTPLKNRE